MKRKSYTLQYIAFAIAAFIVLGTYVYLQNKSVETTEKEDMEYPLLPTEDLFVPINADTLDFYLKKYFDRGGLKTSKKRNRFVVEYNPKALILLHANNNKMTETRKMLETAEIKYFSVVYNNKGRVEITLRRKGAFVDCPALIVAEILRKVNGQ